MDLAGVEPGFSRKPAPEGWYRTFVRAAEVAESKNGNRMIKLTHEIDEGEHKGKWIFDQIMLSGSENAVFVGRRKMKELLVAIGAKNPDLLRDTDELLDKVCDTFVMVEEQGNGYMPKNVVKAHETPEAAPPAKPSVDVGSMTAKPQSAQKPAPPAPKGAYAQAKQEFQDPPVSRKAAEPETEAYQAPRVEQGTRRNPPPPRSAPETAASLATQDNVPF
jgi:hypothetical protein